MKTLFIPFFIFVVSHQPVAPEAELKYSFKVGDQYEYSQTAVQNMKQEIPGMGETATKINLTAAMLLRVQELTPQGAKMEVSFTRMKMEISSVMNMAMDSEGPADNNYNKIVQAMMNKPFFITMTTRGIVEKVENAENIYSGFGSLGLDPAVVQQMKASMQQNFNQESLKAMFANGFVTYPDKKVKVGERWNVESMQNAGFPMKVQNEWTLAESNAKNATLTSEGIITTPDKEKVTTLPNGIKTKTDMAGNQKMTGTVDAKTGWPIEVKLNSQMKGTMTLLAGGMIPQDMLVPMEAQTQSTYTIKKK